MKTRILSAILFVGLLCSASVAQADTFNAASTFKKSVTVTTNLQKTVGDKTYKLVSASETLSALSGATAATTSLVPAGANWLGTSITVDTAVTGATSIDVGDGTDADMFANDFAITVDGVSDSTDYTAAAPGFSASAQDVTLTAVGSNFTAGAVTVNVLYEIIE